uniref:Putative secreted protein n=1 Tax=Amblyomma triste TaxID=251400 RepID=A0A023GAV6_AMBTT
MLSMFVGIYTITIQSLVLAVVPFEDNPQFFIHQHTSYVTDLNEGLIVLRQTSGPLLHPATPCQALRKIEPAGTNAFRYQVYYTKPFPPHVITSFTTTVTTSITALHRHSNVIIYQTMEGGPFTPFKVMYAHVPSGCFIFVYNLREYGRACRLLRRARRASDRIPHHCWQVYRGNCPPDDLQIYMKHCAKAISHMSLQHLRTPQSL